MSQSNSCRLSLSIVAVTLMLSACSEELAVKDTFKFCVSHLTVADASAVEACQKAAQEIATKKSTDKSNRP